MTWNAQDPTTRLGVGGFDGDGVAILFLATGTTWFYQPGATAEWRYLNGGKTDEIQSLLSVISTATDALILSA